MKTPKGMRDHSGPDARLRQHVITTIRDCFERYGFNPFSTPVMERWETLSAKHAGGAEILKETYRLEDQGGRDLGLRYDLTVPLARHISNNPTVKRPFKRYHIGPVFRDGPVKHGRQRQFHQADADIVGSDSHKADIECIHLLLDVFDALDIDVTIHVNNRDVLQQLTEHVGIDDFHNAVLILDKRNKKPRDALLNEAHDNDINPDKFEQLLNHTNDLPDAIDTTPVTTVLEHVDDERLTFNPSLARGLAYYTGTIYEAFTPGYDSSLASGGRYDNLIGHYTERDDYPAVGVSFGITPITLQLTPEKEGTADIYILTINTPDASRQLADELRNTGFNVDLDLTERGVSDGLDYANTYDIPYVILVGSEELNNNYYTVKDMHTGDEDEIPHDDITSHLKAKIHHDE